MTVLLAKQLKRKRLTDQIVDQLVSSIASGRLKKGDKLPSEHQLMEQFGVGRSTIREAVGALLLTGMLVRRAGRGTYISVSSAEFLSKTLTWGIYMGYERIEELVEARIVLERAIAGLAATRAKEVDIAELRREFDRMKSAWKKNQKTALVQADLSFHFALAKAGKNARLSAFLSELRHLMLLWIKQTMGSRSTHDLQNVIKDHGDILDAVEGHDVERAQSALRRHLETSANNLSYALLRKQFKPAVSA